MDAKRFDAIAKAWVSVPRRRLLSGLLGGSAVGVLGGPRGLGPEDVRAATCLEAGERCSSRSECCAMKCKRKRCRNCKQTVVCGPVVSCGGRKGKERFCGCFLTPDQVPTCFEPGGCQTFTQNCTKNEDCPDGQGCRASCCNPGECAPLCNIA